MPFSFKRGAYSPEARKERKGQAPTTLPAVRDEHPFPARPTTEIKEPLVPVPLTWRGTPDLSAATDIVRGMTKLAHETTRYYEAVQGREQAMQRLEVTCEQRRFIPQLIARDALTVQGTVENARADLEDARTRRTRDRELETLEFEYEKAKAKERVAEQEGRAAAAVAKAAHAPELAAAAITVEEAKAEEQAENHRTAAAAKRRERARATTEHAAEESELQGSAHYERHLKTERAVGRDREVRDQKILAIIRKRGGYRNLTDEDLEEIDRIEHAAFAAEQDHRFGKEGGGDLLNVFKLNGSGKGS